MRLTDKCKWFKKWCEGLKSTVFGIFLLFASTIIMEAGTLKLDLEGCHADSDNEYSGALVPDIHAGHLPFMIYSCRDQSYTDGNLGTWAELDMVPHHITFTNTTGSDQNFTFKVGGDFKDTNGNVVGWDYITELTLDEEATLAINNGDQSKVDACRNIGSLSAQGILYSDNDREIFRQVVVTGYPNNLTCVAIYNMRLAIGSSAYPGSSLQSRLLSVDGDITLGKQTLPTSDILSTTFSKTMSAVQNGTLDWSVTKQGVGPVRFGNTCQENASLSKDINITVIWQKEGVSPEGQVNVKSVIKASNRSLRPIIVEVSDELYNGVELLETFTCGPVELNATTLDQTICTNKVSVDETKSDDLHDEATATFSDPDYQDAPTATKVATATASVDSSDTITNESVTITDSESLDGDFLTYAVKSFVGADGNFTNYIMPNVTVQDINWTSVPQNDSGSVTFTKSINVLAGKTITNATIYDTAVLNGSDGLVRDSGAPLSINIYATPMVSLTIIKNVNADIIAENKTLAFDFNISRGGDEVAQVSITVPAGEANASTTVGWLPAGEYLITETAPQGYEAVTNPKQITLDPSTSCTSTVEFDNRLAGRPAVKVTKIAHPGLIGDVDQGAGWVMRLLKQNTSDPDVWDEVASGTTAGTGQALILLAKDNLLEGNYTIVEDMAGHDGWYNVGQKGCAFYYDGGIHADFSCTFGNAKYGKIIINKQIEANNVYDTLFTFDVNGSIDLQLGDGGSQTYENLKGYPDSPVSYYVQESTEPGFSLKTLVCNEYYAQDIPAVANTTVNLGTRTALIKLDPGETVECTFTNKVVENPSLLIDKRTNGVDADVAPGVKILAGDPVNWTYFIKNTGDVALHDINVTDDQGVTVVCPKTTLAVDENMTCEANGTAIEGQYSNIGRVTAVTPEGTDVNATDTSYYLGFVLHPSIAILKKTNGVDADVPPGPTIVVGATVNWTYIISNNGDANLSEIMVEDDQGVTVVCPSTTLLVDENMTCTASGTAIEGQYSNIGIVTAVATLTQEAVDANDTSYYFGVVPEQPSITINKLTNSEDADLAPGPDIYVGDPVIWQYVVTNTGNVTLHDINVTDNQGVTVDCPFTTLAVGENMTCTASGIATVGQYSNLGIVEAYSPKRVKVSDDDPSHYFGVNKIVDPDQNETNCPCDDIHSDSSSAFNTMSSILMIIMTLILGFFFVRKEELNTNEK